MPSVQHKQLIDVANTTVGSDAGWKALWAAAQVMLAAGWTLAGSSDGTTKSTSTDPAAFMWRNAPGTLGTSTTSGSGAVVAAPERGRALVTGLSGMTASMKGSYLKITGSSVSANNNHHQIAEYVSATSVKINATQFAVAADSTGRSWDVRNGLGETYPAVLTAAIAWVCLIGPHSLKIPITAAPSGRFLRSERIVQAASGFEGELRDVVWNASSGTGYLTVFGQVRGTGVGAYGLTTGEVFTGQSTGYTVTQNGTAKEFRLESVIWKAANATTGSRFTGVFEVGTDTRFSDLVAASGCTATVAPGGGGSGNSFPTYAWDAWGSSDNSAPANWGGFTVNRSTQNAFAVCADAIEERGYSADGSWLCATLARIGCWWSIQGDQITEGGDYGDLAPWISVTPNENETETWPGVDISRTLAPAQSGAIGYQSSTFENPTSSTVVGTFACMRGWYRRGSGGSHDRFVRIVRGSTNIAQTQQAVTETNSAGAGDGIPASVSHTDLTRMLLPLYVGAWRPGLAYTGLPAATYHKGNLRWLKIVGGGITNEMLDGGTFVQLATAHSSLCAGPFNGTGPTTSVSRLYLASMVSLTDYRWNTLSEVLPDGSKIDPSASVPADPGAAGWYPNSGNTLFSLVCDRLPLSPYTVQGTTIQEDSATLTGAAIGTQGMLRFFSAPMAAQTISGTIKGQCRCSESNNAANMYTAARLYVITPAGTIRGVLRELLPQADTSGGTELSTSITNRKLFRNSALTSLDIQTGDRLVLELGVRVGAATYNAIYRGSNGSTADLAENEVDTAGANAWIEFSSPITFASTSQQSVSVTAGAGSGGAGVTPATVETEPPTIGSVSPTNGAVIESDDTIAFTVTDSAELSRVIVSATFSDPERTETVYDGTLRAPYDTESVVTPTGDTALAFSIKRDEGWLDSPTINIFAVDAAGNVSAPTSLTYSFTVDPPRIENATPPDGTPIEPDQVITFDVVDDQRPLAYCAVFVRFHKSRDYEVMWDGEEFAPKYLAGGSTIEEIDGGFRFSAMRAGGWPNPPVFEPRAVSAEGRLL